MTEPRGRGFDSLWVYFFLGAYMTLQEFRDIFIEGSLKGFGRNSDFWPPKKSWQQIMREVIKGKNK